MCVQSDSRAALVQQREAENGSLLKRLQELERREREKEKKEREMREEIDQLRRIHADVGIHALM